MNHGPLPDTSFLLRHDLILVQVVVARLGVVETLQELDDSGLAAAGEAHQGNLRAHGGQDGLGLLQHHLQKGLGFRV